MANPCPCRGCKAAYKAALDDVLEAMVRLDDKWSIATQNANTRELMQWCFREYRKILDDFRSAA